MDKEAIILKFNGRDQQICASLFSWINDGSHNFTDDLYIAADDTSIGRYLAVFKQIFHSTNHGAHYEMMMGPEEAAPVSNEEAAAVAAGLATEVVAIQSGTEGATSAADIPDVPA